MKALTMVTAREDGEINLVHVLILAGSSLSPSHGALRIRAANGKLVEVLREGLQAICVYLYGC